MSLRDRLRRLANRLPGSPQLDRLAGTIAEARIDLDRMVQQSGPAALTEAWARAAYRHLSAAEASLSRRELQRGWVSVQSAQRAMLENPKDPDRALRAAIALRQEVGKLAGWRAKAIADLIGEPSANLMAIVPRTGDIVAAVALRDDFANTTYFKIELRRRHLFNLFVLLAATLVALVVLSACGVLPRFLSDTRLLLAVLGFGVLGAAVSVAHSLVHQTVDAKVPAQQIGAFVVWMRPAIGAAAAVAAFALLKAGLLDSGLTQEPSVIAAVAFAAGFSERFIVGAIERVSGGK